MKKFCVSLIMLFFAFAIFAQDKTVQDLKNASNREIKKDPNDTIPKTWKKGGLFNLNFNQAALSNWSAGGDKSSLSLQSFLNVYAFYKKGKNSWDNTLDLAYGVVNTTSLGTRKSDDRIDLLSKYGYEVGKKWYASVLFNFRSQFAKGYAYPTNLPKELTSDFLSPAYVLLSPGFNYKPNDEFSFFISPATARWIIVKNDSLASVAAFGVDSGKNSRFEFGAFASISYNKKISPSAVYTGRLDLFSNYLHNPQDISLYWTNILAVKVTKLISMSLTVNMIYDNDIKTVKDDGTPGGPKPQIQELIGIGLAYKF
ncbi:MAG: DUF3078 domain-containing protein [Bacteroidetes bacterium]|nr:DUF3078 domain-containing protein [Bacteroidota bacterium]MBS1933061.1 DUF3078 domain-containing protein [Bacteroidota bacterium]